MATDNVPNGDAPAPFVTDYEGAFMYARDGATPAILFNPEAAPNELLPLALARAYRLRSHLEVWSSADAGDLSQVASALEPLAQEVELILMELQRRMAAKVPA